MIIYGEAQWMLIIQKIILWGYSSQTAQRITWVHGLPDIKQWGNTLNTTWEGVNIPYQKPNQPQALKAGSQWGWVDQFKYLAAGHCP